MKIVKVDYIEFDKMEIDTIYENNLYHEILGNLKYIQKDINGNLYTSKDLKVWIQVIKLDKN